MIRRCLEPLPLDRYQTASELAADLQAVADDLPLLQCPRALAQPRPPAGSAAVAASSPWPPSSSWALTAVAGSVLNFWNEKQQDRKPGAERTRQRDWSADENHDFATAKIHYAAVDQFAGTVFSERLGPTLAE